jgi:DNA repair protein RadC
LVSLGSISEAIVNPLEIFNLAVRKKSPKIILVHNHPGGSLEPSSSDKNITNNIVEGGRTLTIEVLDHLIISEMGYYSFTENNLL